jgi:chlorite dismutase
MTMAATTKSPTYAAYWLYRADSAFARLAETKRELGKQRFLAALGARDPSVTVRGVYSFAGLRSDVDLMIWVLGQDLDAIQRLNVALRHTGLGGYLLPVETYVGVTTPARYDPEHLPAFMQGVPAKRYISVYPFVKTAEWYLLPFERRRELMGEHGYVGRRYAVSRAKLLAAREQANGAHGTANGLNGGGAAAQAATQVATAPTATAQVAAPPADEEEGGGVLASTVDAFGLGDYEFILANESDDPAELCRMMMSLRATEVRRYTKLDTPIFLGRLREPAEALAAL